jgi:hypothetical protein
MFQKYNTLTKYTYSTVTTVEIQSSEIIKTITEIKRANDDDDDNNIEIIITW